MARSHFEQFCEASAIAIEVEARANAGVSASWREERGDTKRLMFWARHHDLIVVGRRTGPNGLPPDLIETLLLGSSRPLLIAPERPLSLGVGTVVVCCGAFTATPILLEPLRPGITRPVRKVLLAAARSYHADLLVMGAYGHSRTRQVVFGGFTRSVLETADLAVFLMH